MTAVDREAEWSNILDLAKTNEMFAYWLKERGERHRLGQTTDEYTKIIRRMYRQFLRGEIDANGRPIK